MKISIELNAHELQQVIKDGSLNAIAESVKTGNDESLNGAQTQWDLNKASLPGKDGKF